MASYTPFGAGPFSTDTMPSKPWWLRPNWSTLTPGALIEGSADKTAVAGYDVTAGRLYAAKHKGRVVAQVNTSLESVPQFRMVATPGNNSGSTQIKWTDQGVACKFLYTAGAASVPGTGANPGLKLFARYVNEDNLYVASWRLDGTVVIQKKLATPPLDGVLENGAYSTMKSQSSWGIPPVGRWIDLKLTVIGSAPAVCTFYIDGMLVLQASDSTDVITYGSVGVRTDGITDHLLDDWRIGL